MDAHTHPVFVDGRGNEFMKRLAGVSYQEIAKQGGGINASISAVRNATEIELYDRVIKRNFSRWARPLWKQKAVMDWILNRS